MTDDPIRPSEEDRLRELLERAAAGVPISRSEAPTGASSGRNGRSTRDRWLAAVAAVLLVAGGLTWIATGTDDRQVTAGPDEPGPTWCEPGQDVVAVQADRSEGAPRVLVASGAAEPVDVTPDWVASAPAFAPGATALAVTRADGDYESSGPESTTIWTLRSDGTGAHQVTHGQFDDHPDWSPDGQTLVYISSGAERGGTAVMSVPAIGGTALRLTDPGDSSDVFPTWSPDGSAIAFLRSAVRLDGVDSAVWTVRPDGTSARELAALEGVTVTSLSWSPDGTAVAVGTRGVKDPAASQDVVAVSVPDGEIRTMAGGEGSSGFEWSADGDRAYILQPGSTARVVPHHARVTADGSLEPGAPLPGFGDSSVYGLSVASCSAPSTPPVVAPGHPVVGNGLSEAPDSARRADAIVPVTGGFLAVTRSDRAAEVLRYDLDRDEWQRLPPAFWRLSNSVVVAARDDVAVVVAALCWQASSAPGSRCLSDSFGAWTWDEATGSWAQVSMPPDLNQEPIEDERPSMQAVGVVDGTAHFVVDGQHMTVDGTNARVVGEWVPKATEKLCATDIGVLSVATASIDLDPTGVTVTREDGEQIEVPDALMAAPSGPAGGPGDIWQAECVTSGVVIGVVGTGGEQLWRLDADGASWESFDVAEPGSLAAAVERPDGSVTVALNVLNADAGTGSERTRILALGGDTPDEDLDGWTEDLVAVDESVVAAVRPSATGPGALSYRLVP